MMTPSATVVGILGAPAEAQEKTALAEAAECCQWIEVRADLLSTLDSAELRARYRKRTLLYSLRSGDEGGRSRLGLVERHRHLRAAAGVYDLVTLEGERDLTPELLAAIPPAKRIVSWRGRIEGAADLWSRLASYSRTPARLFRFEVEPRGIGDGLAALQFLHRVQREDVIAYAVGAGSSWTRILAPRLGAPIVFARMSEPASEDEDEGEPTVQDLVLDYGLPDLHPAREIFAIIGQPVQSSLSPRLHNSAYRANGFDGLFLTFPADSFQQFWSLFVLSGAMERLGFPIKGLTVASPHKEAALEVAEQQAPICQLCGASNLLVHRQEAWTASTTDPEGIFDNTTLGHSRRRVKVAIIGCGGSGRIIAAALNQAGADVTLVNRYLDRGQWAARLLGLPFVPLESFSAQGYGAIVNATPVGRHGEGLPVELAELEPGSTVVDLVYRRIGETTLVKRARALGHHVVDGRLVLLAQTRRQYFLMTGETMPASLGRRLLGLPAARESEDLPFLYPDQLNVRHLMAGLESGGSYAE